MRLVLEYENKVVTNDKGEKVLTMVSEKGRPDIIVMERLSNERRRDTTINT